VGSCSSLDLELGATVRLSVGMATTRIERIRATPINRSLRPAAFIEAASRSGGSWRRGWDHAQVSTSDRVPRYSGGRVGSRASLHIERCGKARASVRKRDGIRHTRFGPGIESGGHKGRLAEVSSCDLSPRESEAWRVFAVTGVGVRELNLLDWSSPPWSASVRGWRRDEVACVRGCQREEEAGSRRHRYRERDRAVPLKDALGNAIRQRCEVAGAREVRAQLRAAEERWKLGNWATRTARSRILRILVAESLTRVGRWAV